MGYRMAGERTSKWVAVAVAMCAMTHTTFGGSSFASSAGGQMARRRNSGRERPGPLAKLSDCRPVLDSGDTCGADLMGKGRLRGGPRHGCA